MERLLVVNVEAQGARRISDEADTVELEIVGLRDEIRAAQVEAERAEDPVDRAKAQKKVARLVTEEERLSGQVEEIRHAARLAVGRALSLPDDADPAALEPVQRVPLTEKEIAAREKLAAESAWANLRAERDALLSASDWTQQPDAPVERLPWAAYRQQLRDLPARTKDPTKVEWPKVPQ